MKIPKAEKLKSGEWVVRLRLGGQQIHVKNYIKSKAEKEAQKAQEKIDKANKEAAKAAAKAEKAEQKLNDVTK